MSSRRGPKPNVTHTERLEELINWSIFHETNVLKKGSDPIWKKICDRIKQKTSKILEPYNLYTFAKRNMNILSEMQNSPITPHTPTATEIANIESADKNEEEMLLRLKTDVLYQSTIREINIFPFTVFHWPIEAIDFSTDSLKHNDFIFASMGSVCERFRAPDKSFSKSIILYALGSLVNDEFIPICQISTEDKARSIFSRFFAECIRSGIPIPRSIVMDHDPVQFLTANEVFNNYLSIEQYLVACFKFASEPSSIHPPICIIRTHVPLLVVQIRQWTSVFNIILESVRQFYIYCIILLSYQSNIDDYKTLLIKVLVLINSEFSTSFTKEFFKAIMRDIEKYKISTTFSQEYISEKENFFADTVTEKNFMGNIDYRKCEIIVLFIDKISSEARKLSQVESDNQTNTRNVFYNEQFSKELIKLCYEFLIWSKVMDTDKNPQAVQSIMSSLNTYKYQIQKNSPTNLNVHDFLLMNIDLINKKLEIGRNLIEQKSIEPLSKKQKCTVTTYLYHQENWKGKNDEVDTDFYDSSLDSVDDFMDSDTGSINYNENSSVSIIVESASNYEHSQIDVLFNELNSSDRVSPITSIQDKNCSSSVQEKKSRGKFLRPCREIDLIQQKPKKVARKRKVIKNVNLSKSRKIGKLPKKSIITSSCFDAIIEILTSAYYNVTKFQEFLEKIQAESKIDCDDHGFKKLFFTILHSYATSFDIKKFNTDRYKLIQTMCNSTEQKIYWKELVGALFSTLVNFTILKEFHCVNNCEPIVRSQSNLIKLSCDEIKSSLQENVMKHLLSEIVCEKCHENCCLFAFEVKNMICLDIEDLDHEKCSINISELQKKLFVHEQTFTLIGVISFEKPQGNIDLRHYIAHVRSFDNTWLTYDDAEINSKKPAKIGVKNFQKYVALVIYIEYKKTEDKQEFQSNCEHEITQKLPLNSPITPYTEIANIESADKNEEEMLQDENQHVSLEYAKDSPEELMIINYNVESNVDKFLLENNLLLEANLEHEPNVNILQNSLDVMTNTKCTGHDEDESSEESITHTKYMDASTSSSETSYFDLNVVRDKPLIQNGLKLSAIISSSGEKVRLVNTCPIDSIFEILSAGYTYFHRTFSNFTFRMFLEKKKDEIFDMVENYCTDNHRNTYYLSRMIYCRLLYKEKIITDFIQVDCQDNVIRLFEHIMSKQPCIIRNRQCNYCNYRRERPVAMQAVDPAFILEDSLENLQEYLNCLYKHKIITCQNCKKVGACTETFELREYFAVELETSYLLHSHIDAKLTSIPHQLVLMRQEYSLVGAVSFTPGVQPSGLLHYCAFVRLLNGEWEERDDLSSMIQRYSKNTKKRIKPSFLFYLKKRTTMPSLSKFLEM